MIGGVPVGVDVKVVVYVEEVEAAFDAVDEGDDGGVGRAEIFEEDVFAPGGDAAADVHDEIMAVFRDADADAVDLGEGLVVIGVAEEEGV